MKIKQEEDLFCSKLKPRTTEVPLTARMRSRVTIKKEEQPHKVRKTRKKYKLQQQQQEPFSKRQVLLCQKLQ